MYSLYSPCSCLVADLVVVYRMSKSLHLSCACTTLHLSISSFKKEEGGVRRQEGGERMEEGIGLKGEEHEREGGGGREEE